ncbi:MAG: hypothetical protein AABZ39_01870 [Spirochaetota bacterium]
MKRKTIAVIKELCVIGIIGLGGLVGAFFLLNHYHEWKLFIFFAALLFVIGMCFEIFTDRLWEYDFLMLRIPFVKRDLSFSLPLAWSGLMSFCFAVTHWLETDILRFTFVPLAGLPSVIYYVFPSVLVTFLIGNIIEALFHAIHYFKYTNSFYKIFGKAMTPWKIPVPVSLGYGWFWGIVVFAVLRTAAWLFHV